MPILHVKPGKYEHSELKSEIVIWGLLGVSGGIGGVEEGLDVTTLYNAN